MNIPQGSDLSANCVKFLRSCQSQAAAGSMLWGGVQVLKASAKSYANEVKSGRVAMRRHPNEK